MAQVCESMNAVSVVLMLCALMILLFLDSDLSYYISRDLQDQKGKR